MKILVTGGSGVVGEAAVRALVRRGHTVRLLARHADDAVRVWPEGVEAHTGDVTDPASLHGAADGCDGVLHVVGIVDESPPEATFERVNVEGTRHIVAEAARAGVGQVVYVSSLGAEVGKSPYHASKLAGEAHVQAFGGRWVVVRLGNVYGPGDEVISRLLKMVRTLPVVPEVGHGDQPFQPVWADDAGQALAMAVERADLAGQTLELAGPERTSMDDLLDRFGRLTGRHPARVPIPDALVGLGVRLADAIGVPMPVNESQLTMLSEGNVIEPPRTNALDTVFGVQATSLDDGLRTLLDSLPEQLPEEGVGTLHHKRFWADIRGATVGPEALFETFRQQFQEISPDQMDVGAEPGAPKAVLERGQTVTMALPLRGNVQVRVAELSPGLLTLQTVQGHPLAGAVRFSLATREAAGAPELLRFQVDVFDRAANALDWLAMTTVGNTLQNATWKEMVENVVRESGGAAADGVRSEEVPLGAEEVGRIEAWLKDLSVAERRKRNAP